MLTGMFWSILGTGSGRALAVATSVVAARLLDAEGLGRLGLIQTTATMGAAVAALGFSATVTRHLAAYRNADSRRSADLLRLAHVATLAGSLVSVAGVLTFRRGLSLRLFGDAGLEAAIVSAGVLLAGVAFANLQIAVLAGLERFRDVARASAVQGLINFPAVLIGSRIDGFVGAAWGIAAASLGSAVFNQVLVARALESEGIRVGWRLSLRGIDELWQFSGASAATNLIVLGTNWASMLLLARSDAGFAEVGVFVVALQLRTALMYLPSTASLPMLSVLSDLFSRGESEQVGRLVRAAVAVALSVSIVGAVATIAAGPWLLRAYGESFTGHGLVLGAMMVSTVPMAVSSVLGQVALSSGGIGVGVLACAVWATALLAIAATTIDSMGALGLAVAHAASYPLQMGVLAMGLPRELRWPWRRPR